MATTLFTACNSKSDKKKEKAIDAIDINVNLSEEDKAVKTIFLNLPSPIELTQILLEADAKFNESLLNPTNKVDSYITSSNLALNFGIYGTDLCYCRAFEELQQSITYLAVIRTVTDKLQIPEDEGAKTLNRIEESLENRDSIFQIIADTYASADSYLKENERDLTATLILVGGWVEGMHLAVNIKEESGNSEDIINRIAEQKYPLENLMKILENFKSDNSLSAIYPKLKELDAVYQAVTITHNKPVIITDNESKETVIDNQSKIDISSEQLDEITRLIGEIRSIIVS